MTSIMGVILLSTKKRGTVSVLITANFCFSQAKLNSFSFLPSYLFFELTHRQIRCRLTLPYFQNIPNQVESHCTKNEDSIKYFFSKCDQILWNCYMSNLLKKSLMENFIFTVNLLFKNVIDNSYSSSILFFKSKFKNTPLSKTHLKLFFILE